MNTSDDSNSVNTSEDSNEDSRRPGVPVYLEIDTFADLLCMAEEVASWVEEAHDRLLAQVLAKLSDELEPAAGPITGLGQPGGLWARIEAEPARGHSSSLVTYGEPGWSRCIEWLRSGKFSAFEVSASLLDDEGYPDGARGGAHLGVDIRNLEFPGQASRLTVGVARKHFGGAFTPDIQQAWVDVAKRAETMFQAAYGFITLDYAGGTRTPYEEWAGLGEFLGLRECGKWVRGYYWGNFLSAEHVHRLGGLRRIEREAPCAVVEDLSQDRGELVYLQLTEDLDRFSDEDLRALKGFLTPALPAPDARRQHETDYPLRVV